MQKMENKRIYLDNSSTTMVDPEVLKAMLPFFTERYGNASSLHSLGTDAKTVLEDARKIIAESINAKPNEIIFTSGGTESNNMALKCIAFSSREKGNHIITTKVEHKSILNACKWLESQGFEVTYMNVDEKGFVNPDELEDAFTEKTIMVSIIHANNEVGTIQEIQKLGAICKKHNAIFHTDACQSFTKIPIDVEKQNINVMTINSHKIHGPKGVGALYVRKGISMTPWFHGGNQENGYRSGTENIHGVVGFAEAVKVSLNTNYVNKMLVLRDKLIKSVLKIPDSKLNGPRGEARLCNNANFSFRAIEGEALVGYLDVEGISASTGSACSERTLEPSYVLRAMGLDHENANGSLRLTLSRFTTEEGIDYVLEILQKIVEKLRAMSPIGK